MPYMTLIDMSIVFAAAVAAEPAVVSKYLAGYNECASEVQRYLCSVEGVDIELRTRLLNHLANCSQGEGAGDCNGGYPPARFSPYTTHRHQSPAAADFNKTNRHASHRLMKGNTLSFQTGFAESPVQVNKDTFAANMAGSSGNVRDSEEGVDVLFRLVPGLLLPDGNLTALAIPSTPSSQPAIKHQLTSHNIHKLQQAMLPRTDTTLAASCSSRSRDTNFPHQQLPSLPVAGGGPVFPEMFARECVASSTGSTSSLYSRGSCEDLDSRGYSPISSVSSRATPSPVLRGDSRGYSPISSVSSRATPSPVLRGQLPPEVHVKEEPMWRPW